jgi:hypothetical protein
MFLKTLLIHNLMDDTLSSIKLKGKNIERCCHSAQIVDTTILILGGYTFQEESDNVGDILNHSISSAKMLTTNTIGRTVYLGLDSVFAIKTGKLEQLFQLKF